MSKPRLIPQPKRGDADVYDLFLPVPNGMWRVVRLMVSGYGRTANEMLRLVDKHITQHARDVATGAWG